MSSGLWVCLPVIFPLIQQILFACALVEELLLFFRVVFVSLRISRLPDFLSVEYGLDFEVGCTIFRRSI